MLFWVLFPESFALLSLSPGVFFMFSSGFDFCMSQPVEGQLWFVCSWMLLAGTTFYRIVLVWLMFFFVGFVSATATSTELGSAIQILNIFGSVWVWCWVCFIFFSICVSLFAYVRSHFGCDRNLKVCSEELFCFAPFW